ncbi:MAG: phosphatase PAP2 family protein [Labilithrix sp.]|nr:phosphatase PAP2 family protein [Labilithrix sp.]MCW5814436.1 phosphatase PAP2 family protein [Labilithrix sp.]
MRIRVFFTSLFVGLTVTGTASAQEPSRGQKFTADPVADTGVILLGLTFGVLSSQMLSTGEIRPQQIAPDFQTSQLLAIDRGAVTQTVDHSSSTRSNIALYSAAAFALADSIADIWREGKTAALVDAIMYAEAAAITQGVTNLAKIAFRRPRPIAYIERNEFIARGGDPNVYNNAETDSSLSFFSAHTSAVASLSSAATYIAFVRSGARSPRPWITMGAGLALTTFVAYERVRGGSHFPTDVLCGALAGTAVGALVVHLHREDSVKQRPVWIGVTPSYDGGLLTASGLF